MDVLAKTKEMTAWKMWANVIQFLKNKNWFIQVITQKWNCLKASLLCVSNLKARLLENWNTAGSCETVQASVMFHEHMRSGAGGLLVNAKQQMAVNQGTKKEIVVEQKELMSNKIIMLTQGSNLELLPFETRWLLATMHFSLMFKIKGSNEIVNNRFFTITFGNTHW